MQNKIPSKLYKYQPYKDWSLKNLEDHCLRFSKPIRFNDPFDCAVKLSVDNITDIQWNKLFQIYKEELKSHFTVEEIEDKFLTNGK